MHHFLEIKQRIFNARIECHVFLLISYLRNISILYKTVPILLMSGTLCTQDSIRCKLENTTVEEAINGDNWWYNQLITIASQAILAKTRQLVTQKIKLNPKLKVSVKSYTHTNVQIPVYNMQLPRRKNN